MADEHNIDRYPVDLVRRIQLNDIPLDLNNPEEVGCFLATAATHVKKWKELLAKEAKKDPYAKAKRLDKAVQGAGKWMCDKLQLEGIKDLSLQFLDEDVERKRASWKAMIKKKKQAIASKKKQREELIEEGRPVPTKLQEPDEEVDEADPYKDKVAYHDLAESMAEKPFREQFGRIEGVLTKLMRIIKDCLPKYRPKHEATGRIRRMTIGEGLVNDVIDQDAKSWLPLTEMEPLKVPADGNCTVTAVLSALKMEHYYPSNLLRWAICHKLLERREYYTNQSKSGKNGRNNFYEFAVLAAFIPYEYLDVGHLECAADVLKVDIITHFPLGCMSGALDFIQGFGNYNGVFKYQAEEDRHNARAAFIMLTSTSTYDDGARMFNHYIPIVQPVNGRMCKELMKFQLELYMDEVRCICGTADNRDDIMKKAHREARRRLSEDQTDQRQVADDLQKQIDETTEAYEKRLANANLKIDMLQTSKAKTESELNDSKREHVELTLKVEDLERKLQLERGEVEKLKTAEKRATSQTWGDTRSLTMASDKRAQEATQGRELADVEVARLTLELEELQRKYDAKNRDHSRLLNKQEVVGEQIRKLKEESDEAAEQITHLAHTVKVKQDEITQVRAENASFKDDIDELKTENTKLSKEASRYQDKVGDLVDRKEELTNKLEQYKTQNIQLAEANSKLDNENEELKKQLDDAHLMVGFGDMPSQPREGTPQPSTSSGVAHVKFEVRSRTGDPSSSSSSSSDGSSPPTKKTKKSSRPLSSSDEPQEEEQEEVIPQAVVTKHFRMQKTMRTLMDMSIRSIKLTKDVEIIVGETYVFHLVRAKARDPKAKLSQIRWETTFMEHYFSRQSTVFDKGQGSGLGGHTYTAFVPHDRSKGQVRVVSYDKPIRSEAQEIEAEEKMNKLRPDLAEVQGHFYNFRVRKFKKHAYDPPKREVSSSHWAGTLIHLSNNQPPSTPFCPEEFQRVAIRFYPAVDGTFEERST